jgi:hypothetical protein
MARKYSDNFDTTLSAGITAADVSLTVADATNAPDPTGGNVVYLTLVEGTKVEHVSATTWNAGTRIYGGLTRAQMNTTAQAFTGAARVLVSLTADDAQKIVRTDTSAASLIVGGYVEYTVQSTAPAAPSAGSVRVHAREQAEHAFLTSITSDNKPVEYALAQRRWHTLEIFAMSGRAGFASVGIGTIQFNTTNVAINLVPGTPGGEMVASGVTVAVTAGATSSMNTPDAVMCRGSRTGAGGFLQYFRFRPALHAGSEFFAGCSAFETPTATALATYLATRYGVGLGAYAADANFSIITSDGSGGITKTALTNAIAKIDYTNIVELWVGCAPNPSTRFRLRFRVTPAAGGTTTEWVQDVSTTLPPNGSVFRPCAFAMTNANVATSQGGTGAFATPRVDVSKILVQYPDFSD